MVARRTTKKAAASKRAQAEPVEPEETSEETTRRGRTPDIGKYELFAEWAEQEHGVEIDPEQAMFTITNYKHFQTSDMNRQYNEDKRAAVAEAREARDARRAEREEAAEDSGSTRPAKRTAKKSSAASASAPAKKTAAKKTAAKKTTARRTARAAQEAF